MKRRALFVIGVPGTGKTTLTRAFMRRLPSTHNVVVTGYGKLVKYRHYMDKRGSSYPEWKVLGVFPERAETYAVGTDKLSMAVQPEFMEFAKTNKAHLLIEGDRLGNIKTIEHLHNLGYKVGVFELVASAPMLASRYKQRGSSQSETFLKSRATKVRNVVAWCAANSVYTTQCPNRTQLQMQCTINHLLDF